VQIKLPKMTQTFVLQFHIKNRKINWNLLVHLYKKHCAALNLLRHDRFNQKHSKTIKLPLISGNYLFFHAHILSAKMVDLHDFSKKEKV
jgi:hypothetical protein